MVEFWWSNIKKGPIRHNEFERKYLRFKSKRCITNMPIYPSILESFWPKVDTGITPKRQGSLDSFWRLLNLLNGILGLVRRTLSHKCHLANNFSRYTSYCEHKNTWADPSHLHLSMHFHFSVIIGITKTEHPWKIPHTGDKASLDRCGY